MESLGDILKKVTLKSTYTGTDKPPAEEEPNSEECALCGGRSWVRANVPVGHPSFGKAMPCSCQAQATQEQRVSSLQRYSNLGALTRFTFLTLDPNGRSPEAQFQRRFQETYQAALEYADQPLDWLVLTGAVGSGKTHLLAAIVNQCLEMGVPAFYMSVPDLLDHLRSTYAPSSEVAYDQLFDHVRNAPVLALDDLGAHATTPWAQEKLNQILNHRFNRQLPTVVALNVPMSHLDEPLRARLEDRRQVTAITLGDSAVSSQAPNEMLDKMKPRMTFQHFDSRGNRADPEQQKSLESALSFARRFADDPNGWLVFTGKTGCGKTHLAVAIVNQRERLSQAALFCFVPELLDRLRLTFSPQSSITYDQYFEEVRTAPLLVLDDLGAHATTPWAEEKLYQIIVYRQETLLPTVITVRGFVDQLQEAVQSRLKNVSLVRRIQIGAPDYRDRATRTRATGPSSGAARTKP